MEFYGGVINAYPQLGSAFVHRDAVFNAVLDVFWWQEQDRAASQAFLVGWMDLMEPLYNGHVYQNYPRLDDANYAYKYWGDVQAMLWDVKQKYDPGNVFTFAQAVAPVSADAKASDGPLELCAAIALPIIVDVKVKLSILSL